MIELTDWETGNPVFVNPANIALIERLPASVEGNGKGPRELGERTKIIVCNHIVLVRQTPQEVMRAAELRL